MLEILLIIFAGLVSIAAIIAGLIYAPLGVAFLIHWRHGFRSTTFVGLKTQIFQLLQSGFNDARLIIYHNKLPRMRMKFQKYMRAKGEYGIEFCFPSDGPSVENGKRFKQYCENIGYSSSSTTEKLGKSGERREYLCVDFGQDVDLAYEQFSRIVEQVLSIPANDKYRYTFRNLARKGVLVDDPKFLSHDEIDKLQNEALAPVTGESMLELGYTSMLACLSFLATFGLVYSVVSLGGRGSLYFEIGSIGVNPRIFDLICIALIAAKFTKIRTASFWYVMKLVKKRDTDLPIRVPQGREILPSLFKLPRVVASLIAVVLAIGFWFNI